MIKPIRLNTIGDTIVEVLLAIAVIGAILGGAFVSANDSLNANRQAQERGEALKLVEKQLELLRAIAVEPANPIFAKSPGDYFCIDDTLTPQDLGPGGFNNLSAYPPACMQTPPQGGVTYHMSIERSVPTDNTFSIRAIWERAGGGGQEQITNLYRAGR